MNWVLKQVSTFKPQPLVIFRYVDNLFCVFQDGNELEQFFVKIISVHVNIQFTKELEQIIITTIFKCNTVVTKFVDKFETTVFRKNILHKFVYEMV